MEVVLFMGLQASGKSTLWRERFGDTHVRINLDMLRTRHRERRLFETCLEVRQPVVVDNTNAGSATKAIQGLSIADKNELLFARGINFDTLPAWQKRGSSVWWESYEKRGADPRTGTETVATRRRLTTDEELPRGDAYGSYLRRFLD